MQDAKARGAHVVVDVFNDFGDSSKRALHQKRLIDSADFVVSCPKLEAKWIRSNQPITFYSENINESLSENESNQVLKKWLHFLNNIETSTYITSKDIDSSKVTLHEMVIEDDQNNVDKTTLNHSKNRVLVGMLYSGESEYEQAKKSLLNQKHPNIQFFEICNLPNKQAHDLLYKTFMSKADECDFYLKLDADMVLAHDEVITEMVNTAKLYDSAHLFAYVKDCPSDLMIPGIQMFRSDSKWTGSQEQLNGDYLPKLFGKSTTLVDKEWILHMPDPS